MIKKICATVLCLAMLLSMYACTDNKVSEIVVPENALTLDKLQQLTSKEELAALLGIKNAEDLDQMLVYIKNYYNNLPSENDNVEDAKGWSKTDDGYNSLTIAQAKALITPTVVTTENWKDFFGGYIRTIPCYDFDEDGNETVTYEEDAVIGVMPEYYASADFELTLIDKNNNREFTADSTFPFLAELKDGKYYWTDFDEDLYTETGELITSYVEYNPDDFTCIFANGVVYSYELDSQLRYIETFDEDKCEYTYDSIDTIADYDEKTQGESTITYIQFGEDGSNASLCIVGYSSVGNYVYTSTDGVDYTNADNSTIEISPAEELNLAALQKLTTREELASLIGVYMPSQMPQMLAYLNNFYSILPSENDPENPDLTWGVTDDGYNSLTVEQAKSLITATVVTTENWTDYVAPYMDTITCISYDENENETSTEEDLPSIGINTDEYEYPWDQNTLELINNKTGEPLEYSGFEDWPEEVTFEDGKYYVTYYDKNGVGTTEEFNSDNYTCVFSNCVVYYSDIPQELLYAEYYDETAEDWVVVPADEYEGDEGMIIVFLQTGETNSDISRISLNSLGECVFNNEY